LSRPEVQSPPPCSAWAIDILALLLVILRRERLINVVMAGGKNLGFDVNASGTALFIIQAVFLALAWIASFMRAFVKLVLLKKVSIDDYLMLVGLVRDTSGNSDL
jgi:hypothetical protein